MLKMGIKALRSPSLVLALLLAMIASSALCAQPAAVKAAAGPGVSATAASAQSSNAANSGSAAEGDADATDVVVLLDVAQSTMPYFEDVTDYVVSSVVKDYLRRGDTFHLLSFGETAQVEIAQRVSDESDVKAVLGRLYLLYPLARYSDLVGALSYLYQYMVDLPESRRKVVIIITDGVQNPPPTSPSYGMTSDQVSSTIEASAARIRSNGWPVHIIKLPFPKAGTPGAPKSGSESTSTSFVDQVAKSLDADVAAYSPDNKSDLARKSLMLPSAEFPGSLGKKDYSFSFPVRVTNGSSSSLGLELDKVKSGDADILSKKVFLTLGAGSSGTLNIPVLVPDSVAPGPAKLGVRLHFANGVRISPDEGVLDFTLARNPVAAFLRSGATIVLFVILLVLGLGGLLAVIHTIRRMPKRAEAPIAAAVLANSTVSSSSSGARPGTAAAAETRGTEKIKAADGSAVAIQPGKDRKSAVPSVSLEAAQARAREDVGDRDSQAAKAALRIAEESRQNSASSTDLLAQAAQREKQEALAGLELSKKASGRTGKAKAPATEETVKAEAQAKAVIQQNKDETDRTLKILAEASGRRQPAKDPSSEQLQKARQTAENFASRVVKPGSIEIELRVAEQNPHIGRRNIHTISAGNAKSVGGGGSDFLVYLVNVPRRSAEVAFDGEKLNFIPLRPELFPELSGPLEDCLGKSIPMISKGGYPMTLQFLPYERPADKVNKLLHCIEAPGL